MKTRASYRSYHGPETYAEKPRRRHKRAVVDETESESEEEDQQQQQYQEVWDEKKAAAWAMAKKMAPAPSLFGGLSSLLGRAAAPLPAGAKDKKAKTKKGGRGGGSSGGGSGGGGKTMLAQAWSGLVTVLKWTGIALLCLFVVGHVMNALFPAPPTIPPTPPPPRYGTYSSICTPARPATHQHRQAAASPSYSSSYETICTPSRRRY